MTDTEFSWDQDMQRAEARLAYRLRRMYRVGGRLIVDDVVGTR